MNIRTLRVLFSCIAFALTAQSISADEDPKLQQILNAHVEAMGGWRAWNKIESIRLTGTIEREGKTVDFCIIKKRPDQIRATITMPVPGQEDEAVQLIRAYDGKTAWTATRTAGEQTYIGEPIWDEGRKELIEDAKLLPKLIQLWQDGASLAFVEVGTKYNIPVFIIQSNCDSDGIAYRFYLDTRKYTLIEYSILQKGNILSTTRLSCYSEISGILFPKNIQIESLHNPTICMKIANVELGVGIYQEYFELVE